MKAGVNLCAGSKLRHPGLCSTMNLLPFPKRVVT